jgi:hypothetical protein
MEVMVWKLCVFGLLVVVLVLDGLVEFQRRVMRSICLVSDFMMGGGRSLVLSAPEEGRGIGHMLCVRRLNVSMALITEFGCVVYMVGDNILIGVELLEDE